MRKALLLLLIAMMLAGCATGHWTKPNFSNEEWRKDYYECDYNANMYCYRFTGAAAALCRRDNMTRCLQARGYVYVKEGKSVSPDNANAGLAAENRGDYDEAIRLYTKTIESGDLSRENLPIVYNNRGRLWLLIKGDKDLAIADFNKAIELEPQNDIVYRITAWHLAVCPESKYRDGVKAVELAKKAVELKDAANNLDTLAAAYAEAGRFQDAIKTQERAIAKLKEEGNTRDIPEYEQHLASYKAGYPRREKY